MFVAGTTGLGGPLFHKDQVPEHFHESYIVNGYRNPKSPPFQCLLSVFDATNETLNFWTHFLPSWYFMWILKDLSYTLDFQHDSYTWPLLGYMCMCCIYPLASSIAHTFNTMSDKARHVCFFMDYSAIAASAFGTALAYRAYSFPSDFRSGFFGDMFLIVAFINSILCIVISCKTRFMQLSTFRKVIRIGSLGLPCIYTTIPTTYRLIFGSELDMNLTSNYQHTVSIIFMYIAGFLYGTHFPERMFPGSFDIIGHSHQLFHVCVILGTMTQMQAILYDMQERKQELTATWEFSDPSSSIGMLGAVLFTNTVFVIIYTMFLYRKSNKEKSC
ncbi:membrane progestin receptor gamma-like [Ruditapes philippinarum]|uniref:membrane progestin receptor gamma-like n=1 Tax=Ruditapes philippinarum TaxID=129788 RepID=UPI00295B0AF5|nr:membrane progestin receptor gamma-like [Ruditapes philippinarum]XP_060568495.1 membrane progestin receptor gamma-like [Ruditapes philippinarum]